MKNPLLIITLIIGFCCGLSAKDQLEYANVTFSGPSKTSGSMGKEQFVTLVIDGPNISHDAIPIPADEVVPFVNGLMKAKNVVYLGVYIREGTRYGDVIRGIDTLRLSDAKSIGVSTAELPYGREP